MALNFITDLPNLYFQDVNAAKLFSDEAANVYERATSTLLSKNMLLYFAHADYEESRLKYDKVHQIYQKYLDMPDIDPTLVSSYHLAVNFIFRKCWADIRNLFRADSNWVIEVSFQHFSTTAIRMKSFQLNPTRTFR